MGVQIGRALDLYPSGWAVSAASQQHLSSMNESLRVTAERQMLPIFSLAVMPSESRIARSFLQGPLGWARAAYAYCPQLLIDRDRSFYNLK